MAYTVLARRYRSTTFDEIVGQEHIARTLKRAIESGRIAHAFLFCGTRGTGKTSTARIMAKALNCKATDKPNPNPCGECESCKAIARGESMDVIEIDAASNTGVDNIRELIENSQYRPATSRFKVYIIDEVHMLSKGAFNALLKTLEEPPSHVIFILATTEAEKVLPTIQSRCQRYDFRNIPTRQIAEHLREIAKKEKIKADEDALLLVAKAGAGSMRDALSLLDRLLSFGESNLTVEMIEQLLGMPKSQIIFDLTEAIGSGDVKKVLESLEEQLARGFAPDSLVAALVDHLRSLLIVRTCGTGSNLVEVPGLTPRQLEEQAAKFEPTYLAQDIAILEELRRQMRVSQAGRALLDATMVRLTLAEQFVPLDGVGAAASRPGPSGAAAAPLEKKKFPVDEPPRPATVEPVPAPAPQPSQPAATPAASVESTASSADDSDDALPAVGKVWTDTQPKRNPLLKPRTPAPAGGRSNVSAVHSNFGPQWASLLEKLSLGVRGVISQGRPRGIEDGQLVIELSPSLEYFVKAYETNGKKDQIRSAVAEAYGEGVGVKFSIDAAAASAAPAPGAPAAPAQGRRTFGTPAPSPHAPEPAPISNPGLPLTPELKDQLVQEPLIRAIVEQLGGQIVRVEE